jgi:hypothetical protein
MTIPRPCIGFRSAGWVLVPTVLALAWATMAGEPRTRATAYAIQTTATVQITLPLVSPEPRGVLYRTATGRWEPAEAEAGGEALRVSIDATRLRNGRTLLVLDVPADVNLDDTTPPALLRSTVDGADAGQALALDLGGIEKPPETITLGVRDELNALVPDSLAVALNGTRLAPGAPGVTLGLQGTKEGVITVRLVELGPALAGRNTLTVSLADCGLGVPPLTWSLSFRCAPVHRLPDGTTLSVDTVTPAAGWESWQVIADGITMKAGDGTTAGRTWLSEENDRPHWARLTFPAPRTVTGVALWWAFYECYRTSVAYEVQTWDGAQWVTRASIRDQASAQSSRHTFTAVTTTAIRVWQPPGSGHPERAGYMWLSELEVF